MPRRARIDAPGALNRIATVSRGGRFSGTTPNSIRRAVGRGEQHVNEERLRLIET